MVSFFPKYFSFKAISTYLFLLGALIIVFPSNSLPILWIIFGLIIVASFFYYANSLTIAWTNLSVRLFEKKLFRTALTIRLVYVLFSYWLYDTMTGQPFEFNSADSIGYHEGAIWLLKLIDNDQLYIFKEFIGTGYSDLGYVSYLGLLYSVFGENILLVRLLKSLLSAITCVLIYRIAKRNFDERTGKIAGVLALLFPNLIYYCGLHVKETEMLFLTVYFIERADFILKAKAVEPKTLILAALLVLSLFFFRTVLGVTAVLSFGLAFFLSPTRNLKIGAKIRIGIVVLILGLFLKGGSIVGEIEKYWNNKDSNQALSLAARTNKVGGNKLSNYGSAAVFAPLILLGPFPTMVNIETQQNHMLLHGAYFVRNVCGFFVFVSLLTIYRKKQVKKYMFIISFLLGYLAILALSKFALVERFHIPSLVCIIILSAHGISCISYKYKKYFIPYLFLVSFIILGWNLFKMIGRGML